jgi:hypothetical protein
MNKNIAKVRYDESHWLIFSTEFMPERFAEGCKQDIQVILEDDKGENLGDAICHYGSYGVEKGLWEIMSPDLPKKHGDSVMGYLTWKQVEKYFDKTIKRLKKINHFTLKGEANHHTRGGRR